MKTLIYIIPMILLFTGCGEKPYITFYDKNISQKHIDCLRLEIYPPNNEMKSYIYTLYDGFKDSCKYRLKVSTKDEIHCSSTANVPQKVTTNFPSSYLRLDLYKDFKLLYGYYIDLTSPADRGDIEDAFEQLREDLHI